MGARRTGSGTLSLTFKADMILLGDMNQDGVVNGNDVQLISCRTLG